MLFQADQITGDGVLDVAQCLAAGLSLGNAAGQRGAFRHKHAVLVGLNMDTEFHADTIQAFRNLGKWLRAPRTEREMSFESWFCKDATPAALAARRGEREFSLAAD